MHFKDHREYSKPFLKINIQEINFMRGEMSLTWSDSLVWANLWRIIYQRLLKYLHLNLYNIFHHLLSDFFFDFSKIIHQITIFVEAQVRMTVFPDHIWQMNLKLKQIFQRICLKNVFLWNFSEICDFEFFNWLKLMIYKA